MVCIRINLYFLSSTGLFLFYINVYMYRKLWLCGLRPGKSWVREIFHESLEGSIEIERGLSTSTEKTPRSHRRFYTIPSFLFSPLTLSLFSLSWTRSPDEMEQNKGDEYLRGFEPSSGWSCDLLKLWRK